MSKHIKKKDTFIDKQGRKVFGGQGGYDVESDPYGLIPKADLAGKKDPVKEMQEQLKQAEDFEKQRLEAEKDFVKWLDKDPDYDKYKWINVTSPVYLVELYGYSPLENIDSGDAEAIKLARLTGVYENTPPVIYPIVKIIDVGNNFGENQTVFKPGDLVRVNNAVCYVEYNEGWVEWKNKMDKSRPKPNVLPPPKFKGKLMEWQARYRIPKNILDPYDDSGFVFRLPATLLEDQVDKDELKKQIKKN